jgi:cell division protein FtsA
VRSIQSSVRQAGLEIAEIILQPLASSYAVLTEDEMEAGVCLVDIGGGTTDVAVFFDGVVRSTTVIPIGGNAVTEDIRSGCNLMPRHAERLKRDYGIALAKKSMVEEVITITNNALPARPSREIHRLTLSKIIQARMEELLEMVLFHLKREGQLHLLGAGGIVLTGGGSELHCMKDLADYVLGLDARIGKPIDNLSRGLVNELNNPTYATAVGLVVYGLLETPIIPPLHNTMGIFPPPNTQTTQTGADTPPQKPELSGEKGKGFLSTVKNFLESTMRDVGN